MFEAERSLKKLGFDLADLSICELKATLIIAGQMCVELQDNLMQNQI